MPSLKHSLLNLWAQHQMRGRCELHIAADARVDYRGIRHRPPALLSIGAGSIFQGAIAADRAGAEVHVGSRSFIGNSTIVTAQRVDIGDDVLISWGCTIVDHDSHSLRWAERSRDVREHYHGRKSWDHVQVRPVRIGNKVWIGFNTIVLKGVTVGEGAVVAAGSVLTRDVAPFTLVAGNPARVIRSVQDGDPHDE
jgi:acetyltransferase-like isoleucine patch superfamily enzyme